MLSPNGYLNLVGLPNLLNFHVGAPLPAWEEARYARVQRREPLSMHDVLVFHRAWSVRAPMSLRWQSRAGARRPFQKFQASAIPRGPADRDGHGCDALPRGFAESGGSWAEQIE